MFCMFVAKSYVNVIFMSALEYFRHVYKIFEEGHMSLLVEMLRRGNNEAI